MPNKEDVLVSESDLEGRWSGVGRQGGRWITERPGSHRLSVVGVIPPC